MGANFNLLSVGADAKTIKGEAKNYLTGILYLAPANTSGRNICAYATAGCKQSCLFTAGHGAMNSVQIARIRKTMLYFEDKARFCKALADDIVKLKRIAKKRKMTPCVRLNGTSDINWERFFPISSQEIQHYDYTKDPIRMLKFLQKDNWPDNYHITFSRSEHNDMGRKTDPLHVFINMGGNVAVVFDTKKGQPLPSTYMTYPVIDGDLSDLRFLDPKGVIVGLRAKGRARKDTTGFVVKT